VIALVLALATLIPAPSAPGTVLVRDDGSLQTASAEDELFGWRRLPASAVPPGVEAVPNVYLELLTDDVLGSEPLGPEQWALESLGVPRAWTESKGSGDVVLAIIDSGIDLDHPDLADRIFRNPGEIAGNGIDDDGNGLVDDIAGWDVVDDDNDARDPSVGHGTEVAGVAGASLNGTGIAGVAPSISILPIRACSTTRCELFAVAWGIKYATDLGADIINLSLGGYAQPGPLADAVDYAEEAGVLVVAAAGNTGADIDGTSFVPADLPNSNLVAVAATDADDRLWPDSNFGASSVDIAAPGVSIVTTTLDSLGTYRTVSGTSFAAPHVAGTAALILSLHGEVPPAEMIEHLGRFGKGVADLQSTTFHGTRLQADRAVVASLLDDLAGSIFVDDIVWLATSEITKGCDPPANTSYCPDRPVSRGEMAAFLQRALQLPTGPTTFTDTDQSLFEKEINALAAAGITRGCNPPDNTHYCPHDPVTRGEMAAFLYRALS
jgi:subtilisin family serine protease